MRPEIQAKLQRLRRLSLRIRIICKILWIGGALMAVGVFICVTFGIGGVNFDGRIFETSRLPLGRRLLLGGGTALAWGVLLKCFYHLDRLFGNYSRGEIFTRESVHQIQQFGVTCLLWGGANFLWRLSLALSVNPARPVFAYYDSIGIGAIILVISWFMDVAVDLREEYELTI